MADEGIRPYGPGKFSTHVDAYVYAVSLDGGCDDEASDGSSWYGMMRHGHSIFRDHDPFLAELTDAERELITSSAGVIIREDSQGFVYVEYYDDAAQLNADWLAIRATFDDDETEG